MASNSRQRSGSSGSRRPAGGRASGGISGQRRDAGQAWGMDQGRGSGRTVRFETQTIGGIRREREAAERRRQREMHRKQTERKSRLPFVILGVVVFLAISFLIMYYILTHTNIFEIEEINISGTEHLTSQEVNALVSIPQGTTLLNVDTSSVASSMERDAWIQSVDVNRVFPNKLDIVVHERQIGAIVEIPTGATQAIQNWAISKDGLWLMAVPSRDSEVGKNLAEQIYADVDAALHIIDVPYGVQPTIGTYCTDDNVNNALEIMNGMTTELADELKVVSAQDVESTMLTLKNNVEIAFGSATNIREKERICLQIMEENPNVVYINVRVPDRPTWRSA